MHRTSFKLFQRHPLAAGEEGVALAGREARAQGVGVAAAAAAGFQSQLFCRAVAQVIQAMGARTNQVHFVYGWC
jgi:hypothetical protein